MKGEHRISHPNADIIRQLVDQKLPAYLPYADKSPALVILTMEEIQAIAWAACLIDDINAKFGIIPR